jgi:type IV pilus assembly protein PilV
MLNGRKIMHKPASLKSAQQGVILIEVMVAILIFSIGVLAIVGLQASMIKNTADSKYRSEASYIAQSRLGQIWASGLNDSTTPTITAAFVENATDISNLLPGGTRTVTQPIASATVCPWITAGQPCAGMFTVTVTWLQPGPNQTVHNYTTTARVTGI